MQEAGKFKKGFDVKHMLVGIALGYHDKAAFPSFDFCSESESDRKIQENIRVAGEILRGFYESDWHKKIKKGLQLYSSQGSFR